MRQIILWALTIIFSIDSVLRLFKSSFNLGVAIMYTITIFLWIYTFFNKQIDLFLSHGIGFAIKTLFFVGVGIMLVMSVFLFISGVRTQADGDEKAVIVLGAGLNGEEPSGVLARRLDEAIKFYEENNDIVIVVTGGQGPNEIIPEAHAMKNYLISKDVPEEIIIVEDKSTSTEENFAFAKELLEEQGIESNAPIAFATNTFHCYRSAEYARYVGLSNVSSLPSATGFGNVLPAYMREVLAVMYYWVFK